MKRRTFISTLAALAATPAMPAAALTTPSAAATNHFALAKLLARAHNHCTRDMLARHLKVSPEMAREVQQLLLQRGVITQPVAGVSMATNPINTNCVPNEALKPTNIAQKAADVRAKVKELMEKHSERLREAEEAADAETAERPEEDLPQMSLQDPAEAPDHTES